MEKLARDIVAGDSFRHDGHGWDALEDAVQPNDVHDEDAFVIVHVRYFPDGGEGLRTFSYDVTIPNINERKS